MIPKKGTRPIQVGGTKYRWRAAFGKGRLIGQSGPSLQFLAQAEGGGQPMVVWLSSNQYPGDDAADNGYIDHRVAFTPHEARLIIEEALRRGWAARKTAFQMKNFNLPDWTC